MILEGLLTTENANGTVNVAPMGPIVDPGMQRLVLRPYTSSSTYVNLKRSGVGVFHVTDDVEMIARAAVGRIEPLPELQREASVDGWIIAGACRWYALRVDRLDDVDERTRIECNVVARGRLRDFFGFNRAKHAVLEAAILATRVQFLPGEQIRADMQRLAIPVEKTAGESERRAFAFLDEFIQRAISAPAS